MASGDSSAGVARTRSRRAAVRRSSPSPYLAEIRMAGGVPSGRSPRKDFSSRRCGRSDLLRTASIGFDIIFARSFRSSAVRSALPSRRTRTVSAVFRRSQTRSIPSFSIAFSGSRSPAVSVRRTGIPPMSTVSSMKSRVVPGMGVTIARFSPRMRLRREDLPTFGRPAMTTPIPSR